MLVIQARLDLKDLAYVRYLLRKLGKDPETKSEIVRQALKSFIHTHRITGFLDKEMSALEAAAYVGDLGNLHKAGRGEASTLLELRESKQILKGVESDDLRTMLEGVRGEGPADRGRKSSAFRDSELEQDDV